VISGMAAATMVGIFIVPVLFVFVERLTRRQESSPVGQKAEAASAVAEGGAH
jgi:hypothetical protein